MPCTHVLGEGLVELNGSTACRIIIPHVYHAVTAFVYCLRVLKLRI